MLATIPVVFVLFWTWLQAAPIGASQRVIPLDAGSPASCRLQPDGVLVSTNSGRAVQVNCSTPDRLLVCDGEAVEALDITVGEVCRLGLVPTQVGRAVTVKPAADDNLLEVDLLKVVGAEVTRLARRQWFANGAPLRLPVAASGRYLSVRRSGASPVTTKASLFLASAEWSLPDRVGGGELMILPADASVRPEAFDVTSDVGPSLRLSDAKQAVVRGGLLPGNYAVTPVFSGGIKGTPLRASVVTGETTMVAVAQEHVGALAVTIAPDTCAAGGSLRLMRRDGREKGPVVTRIGEWLEPGRCEWLIAGLSPGSFELAVVSREGSTASAQADVRDQQTTAVTIEKRRVIVTGVATLNGRPLVGETLRFVPRPGSRADGTSVETDSSGFYRVDLPQAGDYSIAIGTPEWVSGPRATFKEGENTQDLALRGGSIVVGVNGWDRETPTVVAVNGPTSNNLTIRRGDDLPVAVRGLAFGSYRVSAAQQTGLVSRETKAVTLDEAHPEAKLEIDLVANAGRVLVRDSTGALLEGASVRQGAVRLARESPGVLRAAGVAPGSMLLVTAPGFVPTCIVATLADRDVLLSHGQPAVIQLPSDLSRAGGYFIDLRSECPVPMNLYELTSATAGELQPVRYSVAAFSTASELWWEPPGAQGGARRRVVREGNVLIIQEKQ